MEFHRKLESDPGKAIGGLIGETRNPLHTLMRVLVVLADSEILSVDELTLLGSRPYKIELFREIVEEPFSGESNVRTMQNILVLRGVCEFFVERTLADEGVVLADEKVRLLGVELMKFVVNNELFDIEEAYAQMCAQVGDPLKPYRLQARQGYL